MLPSGLFVSNLTNIFLFRQNWFNFPLKKIFSVKPSSILTFGPRSYPFKPVGRQPVGFVYLQ